ncbi:MAG: YitT family protein [Chloroflexota bacterium]
MSKKRRSIRRFFQSANLSFTRRGLGDYALILIGAVIQALAINLFMVPAQVASGGVSGISQIINSITGWPIGLMVLIGNLPLFVIGWRYLGGPRFATRTIFTVLIYSIAVDFSSQFIPAAGITDDTLLNALYGGVISGIGFALVYRGRGTSGGTDILARILSHYRGMQLSQTYLVTDAFTMLLAGFVFGWEKALYAVVMLYVSGISAETISQGSRVVRTAMIVTNQPEKVGRQIMESLDRGVTLLNGQGMYTKESRGVLYCVISRPEVERLKALIANVDDKAFVVIGQASEALGEGFQQIEES